MIMVVFLVIRLLEGCGSSGDSGDTHNTVQMEINSTYEVYSGNSITAEISSEFIIDHEFSSDFKKVTLTSGQATFTHQVLGDKYLNFYPLLFQYIS